MRQAVGALLDQAAALPTTDERTARLETVRGHLKVLDADGSRGTHNHAEQMRILEADKTVLTTLLGTSG